MSVENKESMDFHGISACSCSYGMYARKCQGIQQTHTVNLVFVTSAVCMIIQHVLMFDI